MTFVVKSTRSNQYELKVVNQNGSLLPAPASVPTVATSAISDIAQYSNTAVMLANDATTYANAVNYVNSRPFVNTSQLAANLANYTPTASLTVATLTDVDASSLSNNATLVYNTANNKYVVTQLNLDGGNF